MTLLQSGPLAPSSSPAPIVQPNATVGAESAHSSASKTSASQRWIDWNECLPDGRDESLLGVLERISQPLRFHTIVGIVQTSGSVSDILSSQYQRMRTATQSLKSALIESSLAKEKALWARIGGQNSGVLEQYRAEAGLPLVVGLRLPCTLQSSSQQAVAALLYPLPAASAEALVGDALGRLSVELGAWMSVWLACRDGSRVQHITWLNRLQKISFKWLVVGVAAALVTLLIPVPYWPKRICVVEPSARQFVASPVNGRILEAKVRPGDQVRAAQTIGRMDDEQLRWELGAAEAELQAAAKHHENAIAHQEGGKVRLAQIAQQKAALRIREIQSQLSHLELQSPIDGIVLQGEWYRSEGAPANRGDVLFEIAPLDRMTIQTHLKTEDLGEIEVGDRVTVRFDNAVGKSWQGKIIRIDPRAEVIDDQVRFVAEFDVDNVDGLLRPGMKGDARIEAGSRTIAWLAFHRAYVWLMKTISW